MDQPKRHPDVTRRVGSVPRESLLELGASRPWSVLAAWPERRPPQTEAGRHLDGEERRARDDPRQRHDALHAESQQDALYRPVLEGLAGGGVAEGREDRDGRRRGEHPEAGHDEAGWGRPTGDVLRQGSLLVLRRPNGWTGRRKCDGSMGEMVRLRDRGALHDVHPSARRTFGDHCTLSDHRTFAATTGPSATTAPSATAPPPSSTPLPATPATSPPSTTPAPTTPPATPRGHDPADHDATPTAADDHCPELRRRFLLRGRFLLGVSGDAFVPSTSSGPLRHNLATVRRVVVP